MATDPVKLQAQVHKLQTTLEELTKERDKIAKDLARVKDQNRQGDAELRKAEAIILTSREAQRVAMLIDERDTYMQQVRAIQELLRENAEELQRYKKLVEGSAGGATAGAAGGAATASSAEAAAGLQERIGKLRTSVKEAETRLAEAEAALAAARAGEAPADEGVIAPLQAAVNDATTALGELRTTLGAAEDEAEAGASEAVRATRAREKLEREQKEAITRLEKALETKIREVATLAEAASNAEAAHARDLENFLAKLNEKEAEATTLRAEVTAAGETMEAFKAQIEEMRRKGDEEARKAVEKALEKARKEKGSVDEAAHSEVTKKLEATQLMIKQLTEANADLQREKDAIEADAKATREKLIKREQKLTAAVQEKAETASQLADATTEMAALRKRNEKLRKENKAGEESVRSAKTEIERLAGDLRKLTDSSRVTDETLARTRASLSSLTAEHERALSELDAVKTECATHADAVTKLEAVVAAAEARIEEMKSEHTISVRLIKQMNRELKTQLAVEARRVAKLEREAAAASGGANGRPASLQRVQSMQVAPRSTPQSPVVAAPVAPGSPARPASGPQSLPRPVSTSATGTSSSQTAVSSPLSMSNIAARTFSSAPTPPTARPAVVAPGRRPSGGAVANMGGGDMEETVRMLGARLQAVLGEAEVAKEKVRMLETIVQDLANELAEKKRLLQTLTASKSSGDDEVAGVQRAIAAAAASDDPVAVMRSLLEKTMSENARMKRDMKIIGSELSNAQDKIAQLSAAQAAPTSGSEAYDSSVAEVYDDEDVPVGDEDADDDGGDIAAPAAPGNPFGGAAVSGAAAPAGRKSVGGGSNPFGGVPAAGGRAGNPF